MRRKRNRGHRALLAGVLGLAFLGPSPALATEAEPAPPTERRSLLATKPWFGHSPRRRLQVPPSRLDEIVSFSPWHGLLWARSEWESPRPAELRATPEQQEPASVSVTFLALESASFWSEWRLALARAREGDPGGTWQVLRGMDPRTLDGERMVRRLSFAIAVARGNRATADSLFYRMSWYDQGRTSTRLAAWRWLERGRGGRALETLHPLSDPTPGERGAMAMARWMAEPETPDPLATAGEDADGLARTALILAAARTAILAGDRPGAARVLESLPPDEIPEAWGPTVTALEVRAREEGIGGGGREEDAVAYQAVTRQFLDGDYGRAGSLAEEWLRAWPDSPYRANTYFIRAYVRARSGKVGEARTDLSIAERLGGEDLNRPVLLLRGFLRGQEGRREDAFRDLAAAYPGPLTDQEEAETIFHRARLARLWGDAAALSSTLLLLEEGFSHTPWLARAREDQVEADWGVPWRALPPAPGAAAGVPAPTTGPWSRLLWGDDFLVREADRLAEESERLAPSGVQASRNPEEAAPTEPLASPVAPDINRPVVFADAGIGAPLAGNLGAGLGGATSGLHYRLEGTYTVGDERNSLPSFQRGRWGGSLGAQPGRWRMALELEGSSRRNDGAPQLGLNPDPVKASWRGVRGEVGFGNPDAAGGSVAAAWARGKMDADTSGTWRTDQTWLNAVGAIPAGGGRWEGSFTLGALDNEQTGFPEARFWYQDLRVVRKLAGIWYVGLRTASYMKRWLVLPVAGLEVPLGAGWSVWGATEPSLTLPSFRGLYVLNGDWNVPDLELPAVRRYIDLRGGFRWEVSDRLTLRTEGEAYKTDQLRTWRRRSGLWQAHALDDATGFKLFLAFGVAAGGFRVSGQAKAQSVRSGGNQVPYVPTYEGKIELGYALKGWRVGLATLGVAGREDETGGKYGNFSRWDVEVAYRYQALRLPLGFQSLEFNLRLENITDVSDVRWPGIPGYGVGVVAGVQALYGGAG